MLVRVVERSLLFVPVHVLDPHLQLRRIGGAVWKCEAEDF